jgi:hypothetical protein
MHARRRARMLTALLRIINRVRAGIDARRVPNDDGEVYHNARRSARGLQGRRHQPGAVATTGGASAAAPGRRAWRRICDRCCAVQEFRSAVVARPSRPRCCATGDRSGGWRRRYRSCATWRRRARKTSRPIGRVTGPLNSAEKGRPACLGCAPGSAAGCEPHRRHWPAQVRSRRHGGGSV